MATIIDVAKAAGVAPSTVSYVLSGKRAISPSTRRLVEDVIRKLGYQRHGGKARVRRRTGVLAVVSSPLDGDGLEIFAAASTAAREHEFDLLLVADERGPAAMRRVVTGAVADAVIVGEVEPGDPRLPVLLSSSLPAVVLGPSPTAPGLGRVLADLAAGAPACAAHLAGLGHRSIAYLDRAEGSLGSRTFRLAFTGAAAARSASVVTRSCPPTPGALRRSLDELLTRDRPTALVVHDATLLSSVLSTLDTCGLRVPQDVSVVAVGPHTVSHHDVPLTTVSVPPQELGTAAVTSAVRLLADPATAGARLLPARLIARESTTAPPRTAPGPSISRAG